VTIDDWFAAKITPTAEEARAAVAKRAAERAAERKQTSQERRAAKKAAKAAEAMAVAKAKRLAKEEQYNFREVTSRIAESLAATDLSRQEDYMPLILKHLEEREIKILDMRFDLDGNGRRTLLQIGRAVGRTQECIRQNLKHILRKLASLFWLKPTSLEPKPTMPVVHKRPIDVLLRTNDPAQRDRVFNWVSEVFRSLGNSRLADIVIMRYGLGGDERRSFRYIANALDEWCVSRIVSLERAAIKILIQHLDQWDTARNNQG